MLQLEKSDTRQLASSPPTPPCLHIALCHHGRNVDCVKGRVKGFGAVIDSSGSLSQLWPLRPEIFQENHPVNDQINLAT